MVRKKVYANRAEQQRAYRERRRAEYAAWLAGMKETLHEVADSLGEGTEWERARRALNECAYQLTKAQGGDENNHECPYCGSHNTRELYQGFGKVVCLDCEGDFTPNSPDSLPPPTT